MQHRQETGLRPYQEQDLDALLDVWYRAAQLAHPFLEASFLAEERHLIATQYIPHAETQVWVEKGRLVGFIAMVGDEIGGLFVDPACHSQGIGRALVDHAAATRAHLTVEVFKANPIGRRFYDRYGFTLLEERIHAPTGQPLLRMQAAGRRAS